MTVEFELDGQRFVGINGGPQFSFDEAVSFEIDCETQEGIDWASSTSPPCAARPTASMHRLQRR